MLSYLLLPQIQISVLGLFDTTGKGLEKNPWLSFCEDYWMMLCFLSFSTGLIHSEFTK